MVDPKTGCVSQAWQWFFTAMWYKVGATHSEIPIAAFAKQTPGLPITMHDAQTGNELGQMLTGITIDLPTDEFDVQESFDSEGNPVFQITWKPENPNTVFAGPSVGPDPDVPAFRALVADDLPVVAKSFRIIVGTPGRKPLAGEELMNAAMAAGDTVPIDLVDSFLECEIAPTADWTVDLSQVVGGVPTPIGTGTILAGQTTGAFVAASGAVFGDADLWVATAITPQDTTMSGLSMTLRGTRTQ